jgi:hypothetical protein
MSDDNDDSGDQTLEEQTKIETELDEPTSEVESGPNAPSTSES